MKEITLVFDKNNCMGCYACEIACKQEHGLDVGPRLVQIIEKSPYFIPIYCRHCVDASCEEVCPVEAISRNNQGIVLINLYILLIINAILIINMGTYSLANPVIGLQLLLISFSVNPYLVNNSLVISFKLIINQFL